jgi:membrane-bound lytic murein transglycosylase MltF
MCVGALAFAMLLHGAPLRHASPAVEASTRIASHPSPAPAPSGQWLLSTDGWRISFSTLPWVSRSRALARLRPTFSPYDEIIVRHADAEGLDWRLVAALIAEESDFQAASQSEKGAIGLMQIMPVAAAAVGAERFAAPDDNVRTGVRYLRHLSGIFGDPSGEDGLGLVLAAYNMGPGHVQDAQALARAVGHDPNRWRGEMETVLPLLEEAEYYTLLSNGFARGQQTVHFVDRVIERYQRYRQRVGPSSGTRPDARAGHTGDAARAAPPANRKKPTSAAQ